MVIFPFIRLMKNVNRDILRCSAYFTQSHLHIIEKSSSWTLSLSFDLKNVIFQVVFIDMRYPKNQCQQQTLKITDTDQRQYKFRGLKVESNIFWINEIKKRTNSQELNSFSKQKHQDIEKMQTQVEKYGKYQRKQYKFNNQIVKAPYYDILQDIEQIDSIESQSNKVKLPKADKKKVKQYPFTLVQSIILSQSGRNILKQEEQQISDLQKNKLEEKNKKCLIIKNRKALQTQSQAKKQIITKSSTNESNLSQNISIKSKLKSLRINTNLYRINLKSEIIPKRLEPSEKNKQNTLSQPLVKNNCFEKKFVEQEKQIEGNNEQCQNCKYLSLICQNIYRQLRLQCSNVKIKNKPHVSQNQPSLIDKMKQLQFHAIPKAVQIINQYGSNQSNKVNNSDQSEMSLLNQNDQEQQIAKALLDFIDQYSEQKNMKQKINVIQY